jgi:putative SOS response-associated peptidase YedK
LRLQDPPTADASDPQDFEQWEQGDVKAAAALMKPAEEDMLQRWPVSKRVNSSRASDEDATLIDAIETV